MAKAGVISATLLWRGAAELDLHAIVHHAGGAREHISHRSQGDVTAGTRLSETTGEDRAMHIHWDKPCAGKYYVAVQNIDGPEGEEGKVPFRLEVRLPTETLNFDAVLGHKMITTCCSFVLDAAGAVVLAKTALSPTRLTRRRSNRKLVPPRATVLATAPPAPAAEKAGSPLAAARPPPATGAKAAAAAAARAARRPAAKPVKAMDAVHAATTISARNRVSAEVRGARLAKRSVFAGDRKRTPGRRVKDDLMQNRKGRVVFKSLSARGRTAFEGNIKPWLEACKRAKLELGLVGFAAPKKGTALYARAKELLGR